MTFKPPIFTLQDVQIDCFSNIAGFALKIIHKPTGFVEKTEGTRNDSKMVKQREALIKLERRVIMNYYNNILKIDFKDPYKKNEIISDCINELMNSKVVSSIEEAAELMGVNFE
jgi:hypothetical protein